MTVKEYIAQHGWNVRDDNIHKAWNVDIGFFNGETGREDETEFAISAHADDELSELFTEFCKENKIADNTVIYVTVVETADDFEDLN